MCNSVGMVVSESWQETDVALFEAAFQEVGKNFNLIAQKLPNKSCSECVGFYYRWKKTRRGNVIRTPPLDRRSCWGHLKIDEVGMYHTRDAAPCTGRLRARLHYWLDEVHNCWPLA